MAKLTRLFSGHTEKQPPKIITTSSKQRIDVNGVEQSGRAQRDQMSQVGHMKVDESSDAMLLPRMLVLIRLQQRHREELTVARKTTQDLRKKLDETEFSFHTQTKEMEVLKLRLNKQETNLDKAMGSKTAAEQEAEQLRSELNATWSQLQVCKDDLFRLQPLAQIPDTEIIKEFESICQDVVSWIDVEISAFEKSHPSAKSGQIFSGGQSFEATNLLERFSTFGEYLVRSVVHRCLRNTMFSRSVYLLGLPNEIKRYLQAAEERMANLEPPRGAYFSIRD